MSDLISTLKPQDQIILLLGQLQGQMTSMQQSVETSAASQASTNAANEAEHAEFRREIAGLSSSVAVLQSNTSPRASWWNVASGFAAVGAVILATVTLLAP